MIANGDRSPAIEAIAFGVGLPNVEAGQFMQMARAAQRIGHSKLERAALKKAFDSGRLPERLQVRLLDLSLDEERFADAESIGETASKSHPDSDILFLKWMACLESTGKYALAAEQIFARLKDKGHRDALMIALGRLLIERMQKPGDAIETLLSLDESSQANWSTSLVVGQAFAALNETEQALSRLVHATALSPTSATAWFELGKLQRLAGMTEASKRSLRKAIDIDPFNATAVRLAGYDHHHAYGDPIFKTVNLLQANMHRMKPTSQVEVCYASAKAYDDVGELATAFALYKRAGQMQKRLVPWADDLMKRLVKTLREQASVTWFDFAVDQGFASDAPVFIVGMPRSGTTLVEQIVSSHPDAFGAGELKLADAVLNGIAVGNAFIQTMKDDPQGIAADAATNLYERGQAFVRGIERLATSPSKRITDKTPGNYMWLGLLAAILPNARFIHCRRHPVDTCLSQFKLYFGPEIPYSYDLRDLGKAYRCYDEIMQHWASIVPADRILHVRYEDIVSDFEAEARRLIAFIDLPWDASCLAYADSRRLVRTASASQVRRPIYRSSVDRWRRYEQYLPDLLTELGELVASYEAGRSPA